MYDLGHVLDEHVPVFPGRYFKQTLVTTAHHANPEAASGENESTGSPSWCPERCSWGPISTRSRICRWATAAMADSPSRSSPAPAGVTAPRGRDGAADRHPAAGWSMSPAWKPGDVISPEHCAEIDPEPGDAVLFHTGWSRHWDQPEVYLSGEPGPGCELAQWLADRDVALTGCDTWSYGPVPAGGSAIGRSASRRS